MNATMTHRSEVDRLYHLRQLYYYLLVAKYRIKEVRPVGKDMYEVEILLRTPIAANSRYSKEYTSFNILLTPAIEDLV